MLSGVRIRYTHPQQMHIPADTLTPFQHDSTEVGLFTFRVLLITRDATRYLQHKVHLPKSLTHAGTCGKALQVQTLSRAKRHSPPLQVLRQSLLEYPGPSDCVWCTYESTLRWKPFQCHRFMYCVRAVLCHAISAVHSARFLVGYCTGRLRLLRAEKKG